MAVGAVSNGNSVPVQEASSGADDVAQLQRQKEMLQKQLEAVKSKPKNSQAEQDAAVKEIELLKSRIAEIDQKIQKLSQNHPQGQNVGETTAVSSKTAALSQANNLPDSVQNQQNGLQNIQPDEAQKKGLDNSNSIGNLLDTYA